MDSTHFRGRSRGSVRGRRAPILFHILSLCQRAMADKMHIIHEPFVEFVRLSRIRVADEMPDEGTRGFRGEWAVLVSGAASYGS